MKQILYLLGVILFLLPVSLDAREKEIKYKNGDAYYGEVKGNKPNGKGKMFYVNGNTYEGSWVKGIKEGEGKMTFTDGLVYEGSWREDSMNGRGKYTFPDGSYCEGEFSDNEFLGGTATLKTEGGVYQGEVNSDVRPNGQGQLKMADGSILDGEFKNGLPEGAGKLVAPDGSFVDGVFRHGVLAKGRQTNTDGSWFEGEFIGNKPWKGTAGTETGIGFSGEYEKGLPVHGRLSKEDGSFFEGEFDSKGEPLNGTVKPAADGDFAGEIKNGIPFNGKGKVNEYCGGVFDGEIKEGVATGTFKYTTNTFSFEGRLTNNEPYGTFSGLVPKENALFSGYYKTSTWPRIDSGSDGPGKMSGYKDITARFSGFMDEKTREEGKQENHGTTISVTYPTDENLSCSVRLEGHFIDNIPQDKTTLTWSYSFLRVTHYRGRDAILRQDYEVTISLQWKNGSLTDGEGNTSGVYKNDDERIDFNEPLTFRSLGASGYTIQYKNAGKESLEINVDPSPASLNTFCLRLANKAKEQPKIRENNAQLQEIESIRRNKAQLIKNVVDPDKVVSADRNTVRANPYLNKMTAYTFKLKKITRDRDYKYRIEATSYYDVFGENTFYIATDDPAFADLDYPCDAYVYAKAQKDSEMVFGRTAWDYSYVARYWFLDAIYLGPVK